MRFLRYGALGHERPGILDEHNIIRSLHEIIPDLGGEFLDPQHLLDIASLDMGDLPVIDPSVRLGQCVAAPSKVIGVGLNYRDHAAAAGIAAPVQPTLFFKASSSLCGPNDSVLRPAGSTKLDWEVEVAVVIGRLARNLHEKDALAHVAGYCLANDITERGYIESSGQLLNGKCYDTFTPLGPWLVTGPSVGDPHDLAISLAVDGAIMQQGTTANMLFRIPELIAHTSRLMTLVPGDVILTGTPAGIGHRMKPARYLQPGTVIELTSDLLGCQRQTVQQEDLSCPV